ncbi:MAG: hypothetical protein JEZ06_01510 [Anaerolineaceae bacterium]|nr:hypothetical protein [Anaerolineaceae bacterium]
MQSDFENKTNGLKYEIKLKGVLNESWIEYFEGMTFSYENNAFTLLTGEIKDQAALHGLLKKIRDLGIPLLSVNFLDKS